MPSLIDIRRRIRAVKSTQQITKAMKMVAASRMRRAYDKIVHARPFAAGMLRVLRSLAARVDPSTHPLLARKDPSAPGARLLVIVISGDKGLAGSFNSNIVKATAAFVAQRPDSQISMTLVGRKARDFFKRRGVAIRGEHVGVFAKLSASDAHDIAATAIEAFTGDQVDAVFVIYNEFKSVIAQTTLVEQLLPVPTEPLEAIAPSGAGSTIDYLYEPDPATILAQLLPRYVESRIFHALLESNAAFYAAQMTAMEAATKNSSEMIESLTLYMNKVRQAAITREIIEVVSGAQAL